MVKQPVASIHLWGKLVGALAVDEKTGFCAFEYAPQWISNGIEISPVHLPSGPRKFMFPSLPFETYRGLPGAFADTLPDDFGNAVIDAWLAREGRDAGSFSPLERLLYTGKRGMGALEYEPAMDRKNDQASIIALDSLVTMAQSVLDQRVQTVGDLSDNATDALKAMLQVGTSAGGARPKAVVGLNRARTKIRSGQGKLPDGYEHFILKFDGVIDKNQGNQTFGDPQGFGRMEYAYYLMARDCGINISYCELLKDGDRAHFMTSRFDRIGNRKKHYQSLCAMDHADYKQPGAYSYEQLFGVMRKLRLSRDEALEMFRRMVFNVVARNHDDHTKNTGFIMDGTHQWQLAPAFDIAYSFRPGSPWVDSHQMSINGKRDEFNRSDLLKMAIRFEREAVDIIERVNEVVSRWSDYASDTGVSAEFAKAIKANHVLGL